MLPRANLSRFKISPEMKYIFITGGVVSSLGKGLTSGALGALLETRQLKVRIQKFDPYLNVDPGTMSPFQHGEVYVLDDGRGNRPRPRPLRTLYPTVERCVLANSTT